MKKRYWFFVTTLVATILIVEYDIAQRMQTKAVATSKESTVEVAAPPVKPVIPITETKKEPAASFFESRFLKQAHKISEVQNDPKIVDERMDQLAKSMNPLELQKLAAIIERKSEDGDNRAMAIELLARSQKQDALEILKNFVMAADPSSSQSWSRNREFESVLKAQAIEGIAAYSQKDLALSYLNSLEAKINESFLKDRIVRSEENLKGRAPTTQQQDEAALKQLVQ